MLTLENVSLRYGSFQALDGVSLNAKEGELVVLLGANGAGKSSIFLTTSGIHRAADHRHLGGWHALGQQHVGDTLGNADHAGI